MPIILEREYLVFKMVDTKKLAEEFQQKKTDVMLKKWKTEDDFIVRKKAAEADKFSLGKLRRKNGPSRKDFR